MALNTFKCNRVTPLHFTGLCADMRHMATGLRSGGSGGGRPSQGVPVSVPGNILKLKRPQVQFDAYKFRTTNINRRQ